MDVRVRLSNDVHAALYGEHKLGVAVGCKHLIGIFLGTGIGGAIIIDGKLYLGATGHAGNIGHYLLQPLGPLPVQTEVDSWIQSPAARRLQEKLQP